MAAHVDAKRSNEALGVGNVTLGYTVRFWHTRQAERVFDARNLLKLVPNIILILGAVVGVNGLREVKPADETDQSDGNFQGATEAGTEQNAKLSRFAHENNQSGVTSVKARAHSTGLIDVPAAERTRMKAE